MLLERQPGSATGIRCDLCGAEFDKDFTYYSLDTREVTVSDNKYTASISALPIIFSFDICPDCMGHIENAVRVNYVPTRVGVNCDLCRAELRGNFSFYYMDASVVNVSMTNSTITCAGCGRVASDGNKICNCGSGQFVKIAKVSVNDKYLQVICCQADYMRMSDAAAVIRSK